MASRVAKQSIKGEPKVGVSIPSGKGCGHQVKTGTDKSGEKQKKQ